MAAANILTPSVAYRDPFAAMDFLERAFGFELAILLTDEKGGLAHAQMRYREADIGVMGEWGAAMLGPNPMKSPASLNAATGFVWVSVENLRAHCESARAAGATIVQEPAEQPYGDATYRALDPEGHVWCFREHVSDVSDAEFEARTGLKYRKSLDEVSR
jgi:uncharacterized glyoxalase superfamily protein PhnB